MADKRRLVILLCTLAALAALSGTYVVGGLRAYNRFQQSSLAAQEHCGGRSPVHICVRAPSTLFSAFYPSYVANQIPVLSVAYSSSSPITLVITASLTGFSQAQAQTVNATPAVQTLSMVPPVSRPMLRKITYEFNTSLHVQVTDTAKHLFYLTDSPLLLHSRWLMRWSAADRLRVAAWVTPNDPAVEALVKQAALRLPIEPLPTPPAMVGYTKASPHEVAAQVDALFDALRLDYSMRYLQTSVPYTGPTSLNAPTEVIKLPAEVLQQRSGMCIELSLLLAAAVERIGLYAEIVVVPGHAFLGVALTPASTHFAYWDPVDVNAQVAGDSANVSADQEYAQDAQQQSIVDTIVIGAARAANIDAML